VLARNAGPNTPVETYSDAEENDEGEVLLRMATAAVPFALVYTWPTAYCVPQVLA